MHTFIAEKDLDPNINDKMKTGFNNFEDCLNWYLDQLSDISSVDECNVIIYGSITLENGAIMRAINSYHKKLWFSNVSVRMSPDESSEYVSNEGICYGQVII